MSKCLDFLDVISLLLNGCFVVRIQPVVCGITEYKVEFPAERCNRTVGRITEMTACKLWNKGFLIAPDPPRSVDGKVITLFYLDKPDISKFISSFGKSSGSPDDK